MTSPGAGREAERPIREAARGKRESKMGSEKNEKSLREARSDNAIGEWYRFEAYIYDPYLWFLWLFFGGIGKWRSTFCDLIDPKPGQEIAELCCGTGSVTFRLAKRVGVDGIVACDLSPDQIRVARFKARLRRNPIDFSVQDASNTSFPTSHFDKVVISVALHEIVRSRRQAIYGEVKRILKPGGHFFVTEPNLPDNLWGRTWFKILFGPWNPERKTARELIDGGLESELGDAEFHIEESALASFGLFKNLRCSVSTQGVAGSLR